MIKRTLPSIMDEVAQVEIFLKEIEQLCSPFDPPDMQLAVTEAVTNAINHGNKFDAAKNVHIKGMRKDNMIIVKVQDEGAGFDPSTLPDPTDPTNLLKSGGRGVFLMKHFADEVSYNDNGTEVTLQFNLG